MILFRNVSLSRGKWTTRFGESAVFRRKVTFFIGRIKKQTCYRWSSPPTLINYSFRIINHSTTATTNNQQSNNRTINTNNRTTQQTQQRNCQCDGMPTSTFTRQLWGSLAVLGLEPLLSSWNSAQGFHADNPKPRAGFRFPRQPLPYFFCNLAV